MTDDDLHHVRQALETLQLDDKYLSKFKETGIGDSILKNCIQNPTAANGVLINLIQIIDHRKSFIAAFKLYMSPDPGSSTSAKFKNTGRPCSDGENDIDIEHPVIKVGPSESQANKYLQESKKEFRTIIQKLRQIATFDINQFDVQAADEEGRIENDFLKNINDLKPKLGVHLIKKLVMELDEFVGSCYAENFNDFEEQKPDIVLQAAMTVACKNYRDEMDKHFDLNKFIPNFLDLSKDKMTKAISSCNYLKLTKVQSEQLLNALKAVHEEYKEKNLMQVPQEDIAIGIDLGTTYSCVSVCLDGKVTIIPNKLSEKTTPSCVEFRKDGSFVVGEPAKYGTDNNRDPQNTCYDAKRLIGRSFSDPEVLKDITVWPFKVVKSKEGDTPEIKIQGKTYFAEEISARVLHHMKEAAENYLSKKIKNAVVTVPAYFNNGQRQATRDAGEIAGLNILKIINEPTAAAIAYKLHRKDDLKRNVLIFDLGGGTFDVAVLTMCDGDILIKAVNGDTHLGGRDFDDVIVNKCIQTFKKEHNVDLKKQPDSAKALRLIQNECEKHKCFLSSVDETTISLSSVYKGHDLNVTVSRSEFENLNQAKFQKCMDIVEGTLTDAGFKKEEINDIVLVGGSTGIPKIQRMLSDLFGGKSLSKSMNPKEAVAYGAAIQASILQANKGTKKRGDSASASASTSACANTVRVDNIKDVIPFLIGVRNKQNKISVYFKKNTPIPCENKLVWKTGENWQTKGVFSIYEGEDPIATNNYLLGKFVLENIPSQEAGTEKIYVTIRVDDDGILHAMAVVESNLSFNRIKISALQGRLSKKVISELKLPERSTMVV